MTEIAQLLKIVYTIGVDIKDDIVDDITNSYSDIKTTVTQPLNIFKNEQLDDATVQAGLLLNNDNACLEEIPKIINTIIYTNSTHSPVVISEGLMNDSGLENWALESTYTIGGGKLLWHIIQNPTSDVDLLHTRQQVIKDISVNIPQIDLDLQIIKETEKDMLWLFTVPELKDAYPINLLFPSIMGVKLINHIPIALDIFQFYRSNILPWLGIIFPLSTFIGPWWYIRYTLKIKMTFVKYCKLIYSALTLALKPDGNYLKSALSYFSLFIYIFFYVFGIIQGFQSSQMLNKMQKTLTAKLNNIKRFVNSVLNILKNYVPQKSLMCYDNDLLLHDVDAQIIPIGMCGLYKIIKDNKTKDTLKLLCKYAWIIDTCVTIGKYVNVKGCCFAQYITPHLLSNNAHKQTKLYNMGHITLASSQVRNPANLEKSLIITGPNAAGKTTYVRAIFTNIILAQSLGIACASHAYILPIHALGTFMRISDTLGTSSLFEAEVKRCAELITQAQTISEQGKRAIYFLDEPMHSTPPIEGSATSKAVIEYIGAIPNVRILVTTHYHDLVSMKPRLFTNVSMDAIEQKCDTDTDTYSTYIFPYKIQKGPSFKCIALELLEVNKLPSIVVAEAIKIKNNYIDKLRI